MITYKCNDCGKTFTEDEAIVAEERVPYGERSVVCDYLGVTMCPHCRSERFDEAAECPICGEWHTGCDDICDSCIEKIETALDEIKRCMIGVADKIIIEKCKGNLRLMQELMKALREGICI